MSDSFSDTCKHYSQALVYIIQKGSKRITATVKIAVSWSNSCINLHVNCNLFHTNSGMSKQNCVMGTCCVHIDKHIVCKKLLRLI